MSEVLFRQLEQYLAAYPVASSLDGVANSQHAAVLLLITQTDNPEILFTRRASHLRNHPGEVCFPGGKWEEGDADLLATALRETHEEIGLPPQSVRVLGQLKEAHTRLGTLVIPYVASFDPQFPLVAAADELDAIFRVPLADFLAGIQIREDRFERNGVIFIAPVYHYNGHEIWGFTAAVTAQLLRIIQQLIP